MTHLKERLVVIGNGMAGCRAVEEVLKRDPDRYEISIFGTEPRVNYNRIMGFDGFGWSSQASVFREWARLTAYENTDRVLNLAGLSALTPEAYAGLLPVQWPVAADGRGTPRLFTDGRFQTPDGRARMVPTRPKGPADAMDATYPMSLNTGRIREDRKSTRLNSSH